MRLGQNMKIFAYPTRLYFLPLLVFVLTSPTPTVADTLVIGVEKIDYTPYYNTVQGEYQGFARDVFDGFAEQYQHQVEYRPMPIKRLYENLSLIQTFEPTRPH